MASVNYVGISKRTAMRPIASEISIRTLNKLIENGAVVEWDKTEYTKRYIISKYGEGLL
jgi:actin-related protein